MSRATFVLLAVIGVLVATAATQQCPLNQEFTTCGSACPPTCSNSDPNQPCTLQCVPGCRCKQGYLLNSAGSCVTPLQC